MKTILLCALFFIFVIGCQSTTNNLYKATKNGDIGQIRTMMENGADVNAGKGGVTPLLIASMTGRVDIVKLLVDAKADVNAAAKTNGFTPLFVASQTGRVDIVKLLVDAKADVNAADKDGVTPLYNASTGGHVNIVKLLVDAKADVNAAEKDGVTPLLIASRRGHVNIVKLLLDAKADVNAVDKTFGVTPLLIASQEGHVDIVKLLLDAKADVNIKSPSLGTSLSTAKRHKHHQIITLLKEYGAKDYLQKEASSELRDQSDFVEDVKTPVTIIVKGLDAYDIVSKSFVDAIGKGKINLSLNISNGEMTVSSVENITSHDIKKFLILLEKNTPEIAKENEDNFDKIKRINKCMVEIKSSKGGFNIKFTPDI